MITRQMLIVDDERDICDCLSQFFSTRGFSTVSAFSGEEALARIEQGTADVVLLDILLPGLSGLEVLKRIKEAHPRARVVMVTAVDQEDVRLEARRQGACGFVTKPFDFSLKTWASVWQAPISQPPPAS